MKPQRLAMSMAPNKSYLEGHNSALDAAEAHQTELEDMLRKLLDGSGPKVDTPEEVVLRCKAYELLGDLHASFKESMRMARVKRYQERKHTRATGYDVDMDKEKDAQ